MKKTLPQRYIPTDRVIWKNGSIEVALPTTLDLENVIRYEQFYDSEIGMKTECTLVEVDSSEPFFVINLPYDVFDTFFRQYAEYWYKRSGSGLVNIN